MFLLSTLLKFLVIWILFVVMIDGFNILGPSYMKNICKDQTVDDEYMGCCTNECCQDLCVERGAMVYKKNVVNHTEENHEEKMVELVN
ncbi:hypothetical protein M3Y96_00280700 [Aphelenchoides besseyi]|nr:hypothetical protein M3Y96_00280700 [Aphelenchoides besseyi]